MEAIFYREGDLLKYTPGADITGGQVLQVDSDRAAVADRDIDYDASETGSVRVKGIFKIQAAAVVGNVGDVVWWDDDGSPYGGTASSGAATTSAASGDYPLGSLTYPLTATDGYAYVALNEYCQDRPVWANRTHELKSDNYTVDVQDSGKIIHIATDAKAFTLPDCTTCVGLEFTIVNDGADGTVAVNISPNANDKIMGPDIAGTDNKDQINTKSTAVRGDYMTLRSEGTAGWWIIESRGTWAEEG